MKARLRVAADIGGTFTDIALIRWDETIATRKVPSTPDDYGRGVVSGIMELLQAEGLSVQDVGEVMHACTVATNVILEGKGARTALITTAGFRDVLEMRRIRVPRLYEPLYCKPPPLSPRRLRLEVGERVDFRGNVLVPLDEASVLRALDTLDRENVEAVAVCLLHSYANDFHERRIGEMIAARFPDMFVSLSVDVLPEMREYERTSTTVINSYVGPPVRGYLASLTAQLADAGLPSRFFMMHSAGGIVAATSVVARPAQIVECGPAAGVLGALRTMVEAGHLDVISFDMGGTTAKASLIEKGALVRTDDYEVGGGISISSKLAKGGGYALKLPVIDISEVGAGGGSIVWMDPAGGLKVGPHSAGASPGPACYGRGGTEPTVTDANVVLGFLNPKALAGGSVPIEAQRSVEALCRVVATPLGMDMDRAAHGVHQLVSTIMTRAVKSVTTFRGRDPREFAMIAFGGNGGIHAISLARALGIRTVYVPPGAGVFSALGLLYADIETSKSAAFLKRLDEDCTVALTGFYAMLLDRVRAELARPVGALMIERAADLRYVGQAFEITIPFSAEGALDDRARRGLRQRFESEYERIYGYRLAETAVEIVTLRLTARVPKGNRKLPGYVFPQSTPATTRDVYFGPEFGRVATMVVGREALTAKPGPGPMIIEEYEGTTIVPPDCHVRVDDHANIVITLP
ncbi:hydantoinase/oxoprolinase family protein [Gluconacetobacter azotocaptans]|uniref:Hydantoinase/oxoprolinase family protein n=1 Tax=Gluconacetobacter azotocaptans TaxID=142834 RepID=A0A7W4JTZ8_9PROT|nr:hydantoinase/oxoprolinase family protein [Gluconacetobacter azotocaptans]MBB2190807.1 hydantoinase/oxoprolinase family protein [Gluconacetobacter azotocaptans]MBM9400747.1 hydantoinase/oxoprolinase family protein [Gluconacetobacter azotocaptans]GBQ30842.1 N-methylhydantoinase A [Gluconacetobacter azotocaptans DSM 13594]